MLTFEKVLNVFSDYLQQAPLYEVVLTSHGYTLMAWEPERNEWYQGNAGNVIGRPAGHLCQFPGRSDDGE